MTTTVAQANPAKARWARTLLFRVVRAAVLAYAGVVIMLFFIQDMLLFPATKVLTRDPSLYGWAYEDVMLPVGEERTHAWWIPQADARGVCLFSHGNAGNIGDRLEGIGLLREFGLSVLAYDYGGYGRSTGRPSERRINADVRAAWAHLVDARGVAPDEIIVFGRSLGGGPPADLAVEVHPAGVVLESTFKSVPAMAQELYPFLPAAWLVRHRFDNQAKVASIDAPLLIVHSAEDTLIPYHHGQALFEAAAEPKRLLEIHGDHNNGFALSMDVYKAGWEAFLEDVLP